MEEQHGDTPRPEFRGVWCRLTWCDRDRRGARMTVGRPGQAAD